ncbi:MAG: DUF2505 domain-containing protein [Pseudonocardiaceae bacterium]
MTNRVELWHSYPESPERMREVLTDPDYLRGKLHAVGGPRAELVSRDEDAQGITILLHQMVPPDALPSVIRSLLPSGLTVHRTETWTPAGGVLRCTVDGAPGTIIGTMTLNPDPAGSVLLTRLEATIPLPLIGGKVEKAVTGGVSKLMNAEYDFTMKWLHNSATT